MSKSGTPLFDNTIPGNEINALVIPAVIHFHVCGKCGKVWSHKAALCQRMEKTFVVDGNEIGPVYLWCNKCAGIN